MSDESIQFERVEELHLDALLEKSIAYLISQTFKTSFDGRTFFQNRHHRRYVAWNGDQLVGHLAICFRAIQIGDQQADMIGIAEVVVAAEHRRKGIASHLLDMALEDGTKSLAHFAVLFGEQAIYAKAGFIPAANPLIINEMTGARTGPIQKEVHPYLMVKQLKDLAWADEVEVDLAGFKF